MKKYLSITAIMIGIGAIALASARVFGDVSQSQKEEHDMNASEKAALKIGDPAPDFKDLPGVDGKKHSLSDYNSSKVLVVIFSCNHCPYVKAYEDRMIALQQQFKDKGVQFVAINSNDDKGVPEDSFDNMVIRAKEKNFSFPYLRDESQNVARAYGAAHTPQIFAFDEKRKLSYTGKIDDNWQSPDKVKKQFLRDALASLVEGKKPAEPETYAIGCTIKWKS